MIGLQETFIFAANAAAGTYNMPAGAGLPQGVSGGLYVVMLSCTGTPSLQVQALDPSGNWVNVGAAFVTASGGSFTVQLPPGVIRITVATSTANYVTVSRCPQS